MKKNLLSLVFLLLAWPASAAITNRITATVTITNVPTMVPTNTLTINSKTITWTNAVGGSPSTLVLTNTTVTTSATNLYNQLQTYQLSGPIVVRWSNTNAIDLVGQPDQAMILSRVGNWASITYSTQVVVFALNVRVPISVETATNRQFIASGLVQGISDYSTSAVAMAATAMTNFVGRTNQQTIGQKFITNSTFLSPITTNLVNYGEALHSPGTNFANSFQAGYGAQATNNFSMAVGVGAKGYGLYGTAAGNLANASGEGSSAGGVLADASGYNSSVWGAGGIASGYKSTALGTLTSATHSNSTVLGVGGVSTEADQIMLGTSTVRAWAHKLVVDTSALITNGSVWGGALTNVSLAVVGQTVTNQYVDNSNAKNLSVTNSLTATNAAINGLAATNSIFRGTNIISGDLSFTRLNVTSIANGNNSGLLFGTNTNIKISGPSAAFTFCGISGGRDGKVYRVTKTNSFTWTIANDSGTDPVAANRILTGTGADITVTNNPGTVWFYYDSEAARWNVDSKTQ